MDMDMPAAVEEQCPSPPVLPVALANNILPVPYNQGPDSASLPPSQSQVEAAAARVDPENSGVFDEPLREWAAFLEARSNYQRRAAAAMAEAAAAAAAELVIGGAEAERLEREKKFLSTYTSPLEPLRARANLGEEFNCDMHNWQAKACGQLQAFISEGHAKIRTKLRNEPHVCSGKPSCQKACGIAGAPCTCTDEDKLVKYFHTELARIARVWVTQGGGKTLVECLHNSSMVGNCMEQVGQGKLLISPLCISLETQGEFCQIQFRKQFYVSLF